MKTFCWFKILTRLEYEENQLETKRGENWIIEGVVVWFILALPVYYMFFYLSKM